VTKVIGDPQLKELWLQELASMRDRINDMRELFAKTLKELNVKEDFSFITQQHGLFSFTGLSKEQVEILKDKHSIYIVGSGRINISGLTTDNMGRICEAIAEVLSD
jgi:aspartate/tyrosine/aromatic aminotransferase